MDFKKARDDLHERKGVLKAKEDNSKRSVENIKTIMSKLSAEDIKRFTDIGIDVRSLLNANVDEAAASKEANMQLKENARIAVQQVIEFMEQNRVKGV